MKNMKKLINALMEIGQKCLVKEIVIGYEPAVDNDMKIIELVEGRITKCNQKIFRNLFATVLYQIAEMYDV